MICDSAYGTKLGKGCDVIRLSVSDAKLHCHHEVPDQSWSISVGDIVLIAEYTTDEGPQADDYFLVFITREQGEFYYSNVTMYAAGIDESLTELERMMGCSLDLTLHSSTKLSSRVVWPPKVAGSPYFRYEQVVPEGFWDRLRSRVQGKRIESHVADSVCAYLAGLDRPEVNAKERTPSP
jgi:hypothetical protein